MGASLFLKMLEERVPIIFDGAMGTQIKSRDLQEKDYDGHAGCVEIITITKPDIVIDIHREFLLAGACVVETNTLGANAVKLAEYGLSDRVREINRAAALNARKAIDAMGGIATRMVCGSIGPTGRLHLPGSGERMDFDGLANIYKEQALGLIDGGADMLLLETMQDLLEVRAAMYGIGQIFRKTMLRLPLLVQVTMDAAGQMLLGSDILAFLGAVANLSPEAIGLNCGGGPREMRQNIRKLLSLAPYPVSMMPNAGMPKNIDGKAAYDMGPDEFTDTMVPLVTQDGLAIAGGCCGTTPAHIRALSLALEGKTVAKLTASPKTFLSPGITGIALEDVKRPIIIGERLNTQGSKKTKELVLAGNFDELYHIAVTQAQKGASILDLCVATNERDDEKETMTRLVGFLSQRIATPLCIDSTEAPVIEAAVKACPGSVMINSINFERGGEKARPILALARDFGCPVIALTIDDAGMATTVQRKLDLARRLCDLACGEFGLPQRSVFVDPLTFTLATGETESANAGKATIEAVFRIRDELPGLRTILGVSNVSYGLNPRARRVLNNLMLHHAFKAGLDAAIFNPLHLDGVEAYEPDLREAGERLLFNRDTAALAEFIGYFEEIGSSGAPVDSSGALPAAGTEPLERQLWLAITKRDRRGLAELIETLLSRHGADGILTTILLPAMAEVGEKMSKGEMILPFVLQAAEIMKEALSILEPHRKSLQSDGRGTIVLATVYGDVHDIGKNLVGSILKSQGFNVQDLGKQVPVETIVETVMNKRPDAIGLSALLVTTSKEMQRCVEACSRHGLTIPIIIGGAAVNREFAERICHVGGEKQYAGGVYYAKDAFEAVRILDGLKKAPRPGSGTTPRPGSEAGPVSGVEPGEKTTERPVSQSSEALTFQDLLIPPFYGTGEVLHWEAEGLLDAMDSPRLFKGYWGGGNLPADEFEAICEKTFDPALMRLEKAIIKDGLLDAKGLYGFFSVYTMGETLFILDPGNFHTELASIVFPTMPQKGKNGARRSLLDFLKPEGDIIAIQAVTIGSGLTEASRRLLQDENRYSEGFFLNGIGNYLTEELARRVTAEIRRGLFLPRERGRRYSFGYPGLPGLEEQVKLLDILGVEDRLGITLTPGFQMQPEHSTIGIFIHHPKADYF